MTDLIEHMAIVRTAQVLIRHHGAPLARDYADRRAALLDTQGEAAAADRWTLVRQVMDQPQL